MKSRNHKPFMFTHPLTNMSFQREIIETPDSKWSWCSDGKILFSELVSTWLKRRRRRREHGGGEGVGELDKACRAPEVNPPCLCPPPQTPGPQECVRVCESPVGCIVVCGASCSANTAELLYSKAWTWEGACNVGGLDTKQLNKASCDIVTVCCVKEKKALCSCLVTDDFFTLWKNVWILLN